MHFKHSILTLFLLLSGCSAKPVEDASPYSLSKPDAVYELPKALKEISGIALVNDSTLACVEDEHGVIYFYNLNQRKISHVLPFGPDGDYEDIAIKGDTIFVLRSDGLLYEISQFNSKPTILTLALFEKHKEAQDVEGLWYISKTNELLLASKSDGSVYSYSLGKQELSSESIKIKTPFRFYPSAVAVHSISSELYVLESKGNSLLILKPSGEVNKSIELHGHHFKQPEGIAFSRSGDLYISNEGRDGKANILFFRMLVNINK